MTLRIWPEMLEVDFIKFLVESTRVFFGKGYLTGTC